VTDQAVADPVRTFIDETVRSHDVVLFMKGTPDAPRCGFSSLAVQILDHIGAPFVGVDVLQDEALREGIKAYTDWPTIPQLYVKGELVGGSDIIEMGTVQCPPNMHPDRHASGLVKIAASVGCDEIRDAVDRDEGPRHDVIDLHIVAHAGRAVEAPITL